jgi:two-component system response regulator MprA
MLRVRNFHILVVEDDDTVRRLLTEHLATRMQLTVDSARDGVEALHQIATTRYAVVILDVMMPKMSGVDLLDSLQALTSDPSVKAMESPPAVLVITAAPEAALPDEAIRKRGPGTVRAIFRKPIDVAALAASVEKYLR